MTWPGVLIVGYYRSWRLSPPACAVAEAHRRYTGETRVSLIGRPVRAASRAGG